MFDRAHQPPSYTPMAGSRAGLEAGRSITGALRAIEAATEAFRGGPKNDHTRDALAALKRAERELSEALACAEHLRKG